MHRFPPEPDLPANLYVKEPIMRIHYLTATATLLFVSGAAFAAGNAEALFAHHKCIACHEIDNQSSGPSLKDIAARYAGDKTAQAHLEQKMRSGGSGSFGTLPMPATPKTVSDADIKTMVKWILSLK